MKIAVVSFYYYNNNYWCNYDNLEEYCNYHGYDLHYTIKKVDVENIHKPTYDGIKYIRELLDKGYDYVFWFDATDTIITNKSIKLEDIVGDKPIQFSNDVITSDPVKIYECNSGFWGVSPNNESKRFLEDVLDTYDPEYYDGWSEEFWGDQNALNGVGERYLDHIDTSSLHQSYWFYSTPTFYNKPLDELIKYLGNQSNNPNVYSYGDFMIHFAGKVVEGNEINHILKLVKNAMASSSS